jgi:hypothetical protein
MPGAAPYPQPDPSAWGPLLRAGWAERLSLHLRDGRYRRRGRRIAEAVLTPVAGTPAPVAPDALVLICVVRNASAYISAFLDHYRGLGVARFAIVDDRSDDGTREILDAADDVDRFASDQTYREAAGGLAWRDALIERYGRGRWYVSVDADEFLVYPGSETRKLPAFVADLARAGLTRALAPMLDLYPEGRLADAAFDPARHRHPAEVSPMIDGDGYHAAREKFSLAIRGGPRTRIFGGENRLSKFPLIFADRATAYRGGSIHGPLPVTRNFSAPAAVLLHFKFSAASLTEFRTFVAEGGHFGGSMFYRRITERADFGEDLSLAYPGSIRVEESADLVRRGFMVDLSGPAV